MKIDFSRLCMGGGCVLLTLGLIEGNPGLIIVGNLGLFFGSIDIEKPEDSP